MTRTADVVVVGGGTNGASTAFHLTLLGVRNVVLLERRQLAAGAAAWEAAAGFADPAATAFAFAEAAKNRGAAIETGVEVQRVIVEGGRVTGVETSAGRIDTPKVVIVAGAWAGSLLGPLGLD